MTEQSTLTVSTQPVGDHPSAGERGSSRGDVESGPTIRGVVTLGQWSKENAGDDQTDGSVATVST